MTANAISPGGQTRFSAASRAADTPEPDQRDPDAFDPMDPSLCSPVVAWLASPEAGYVSGQVVRAIGETIDLMSGWSKAVTISNGATRWDANTLGQRLATDVFKVRTPGLRLGS